MEKIKITDFLINEMSKLGITDFFGLPGDFNFSIIESVEKNPITNWIGCTNELNASYAADGYSRIKGYGALITTYNVGELSAINGIAGSFAENIPVISIVGHPDTNSIKNKELIHHSFIKQNYKASQNAYSNITCATTVLSKSNAKEEIERVLNIFIKEKLPIYIGIPKDVSEMVIDNKAKVKIAKSNIYNLNNATNHALNLIQKAHSPIIIGDNLINIFNSQNEFKNLINHLNIPFTILTMGKGLIDEDNPNFLGTYLGSLDNHIVYNYVNESDLVISVGTIYSDFNILTPLKFNPEDNILIQGTKTIIEGKTYNNVLMADILRELTLKAVPKIKKIKKETCIKNVYKNIEEPLNFKYIIDKLQEFFKPNDRIFVETGLFAFALQSIKMKRNTKLYSQLLWCSIGWATSAVFGACIANSENRTILLTGEGSQQLTIQSISNMLYRNLKPIIFVLNNSGYSIERVLSKNKNDKYNDIIPWDYSKIISSFNPNVYIRKVKTNNELNDTLNIIEEKSKTNLCYIELFTDKFDIPDLLEKYKDYKSSK